MTREMEINLNYDTFKQPYEDALNCIRVRLEALNNDYRRKNKNYPIHNIQSRIKTPESIYEKLERKGLHKDLETAKDNLTDIAGIRIICYFSEDVYTVESMLKRQSDLTIIKECDYIKNHKDNGYRSYHLVVAIPVYYSDSVEYYPVEIQLRTISMDFWASMEHRIRYKNEANNEENIKIKMKEYSDMLAEMEERMRELL